MNMTHLTKFTIAAAVITALTGPASAYTVKGSIECPDVIREDSNEDFRNMNKWWLLGYFSARNYSADASVGKDVDNDQIYRMALNFCQENAPKDWDDAAIHIYKLLK